MSCTGSNGYSMDVIDTSLLWKAEFGDACGDDGFASIVSGDAERGADTAMQPNVGIRRLYKMIS